MQGHKPVMVQRAAFTVLATGLLIAACAVTGEWTGFSERSRSGEERPTPESAVAHDRALSVDSLLPSLPPSLTHSLASL